MCRFIESISFINGSFKNLALHNKRVNETRKVFFKQTQPIFIEKEIQQPKDLQQNTLYKCRIVYAENIEEISFIPYQPKEINSISLIFDNQIEYAYKYKNRDSFEHYLNQSASDEIILIKNGFVTDTSYSNLIFFDEKKWVTPKSFLLNGIQRQYLLQNNIILEKEIKVADLPHFSHFKLINALLTIEDSPLLSTTSIIKTI